MYMKKSFTLFLITTLLIPVVPHSVYAQNEGVNGMVDVRVMAHATTSSPFEYVGLRFTTTGDLPLDLTGFTIHDRTGVRYAFSSYVLQPEAEVLMCQNTAEAQASGLCTFYAGAGAIWNNDADTFIFKDQFGVILFSFEVGGLGVGNEATGNFAIDYPVPVVATLTIIEPPEDDLVLSGATQFMTDYTDDDAVEDELVWSLHKETCTGEVLLSSVTQPDLGTRDRSQLTVEIDLDTVRDNGTYCFVVDRVESGTTTDLVATRTFLIDRYKDPVYRLEGSVYLDVNGNGRYESAIDQPVANRQVTARDERGEIRTGETDTRGFYSIIVEAGVWSLVDAVPIDWVQTGVVQDGRVVYSTPREQATKTLELCTSALPSTDQSGAVVVRECTFLSTPVVLPPDLPVVLPPTKSSGTRVGDRLLRVPRVLGLSTTTQGTSSVSCGRYLTTYLGPTWFNPPFEVQKLQLFLTAQGWFTPITGRFDTLTTTHVKALQVREQATILMPWVQAGLMAELLPTGYVYKTTRAYINNTICPGSDLVTTL